MCIFGPKKKCNSLYLYAKMETMMQVNYCKNKLSFKFLSLAMSKSNVAWSEPCQVPPCVWIRGPIFLPNFLLLSFIQNELTETKIYRTFPLFFFFSALKFCRNDTTNSLSQPDCQSKQHMTHWAFPQSANNKPLFLHISCFPHSQLLRLWIMRSEEKKVNFLLATHTHFCQNKYTHTGSQFSVYTLNRQHWPLRSWNGLVTL